MTVGNAVVKGAKQGLQENAAERFTGHLTLIASDEDAQTIFFTENTVPLKQIRDYPRLKSVLAEQDIVEGFLPMSRGYAMILNGDSESKLDDDAGESATFLFGVDFEQYQTMFKQNIIPVEGALLKDGERGALITEEERLNIFNRNNIWVVPQGGSVKEDALPPEALEVRNRLVVKDELVFLGLSGENLESDIRVPVKGIVKFQSLNKVWAGSFIDIESFRQCFGYLSASAADVELSGEQAELLTTVVDEADLFGGDDELFEEMGDEAIHYDVADIQQQTERDAQHVMTENGAYQFLPVKLKSGVSIEEGIARLQQVFAEAQINVKILNWKQATGSVAQMAGLVQGILTMFVLFIVFVAAVVITNTLIMAALERTSEIGMMRAIGSPKGFISTMFMAEIATLAAVFGGLGMAAGVLVVAALNVLQIQTDAHWMLSLLSGSDVLHPVIDVVGFVFGSGQLAAVTLLAALYPIVVARKITPLEAIARD